MADVLGVDLDVADRSAPFVITAELPDPVLQTAEFVRQRQVRDEWRARKAQGEIPEGDDSPPPGLSLWLEWEKPLMAGILGGAAFGFLVQLIAKALGALFGFRPGPVGLLAGILGAVVACFAVQSWQEHARKADLELLNANQRKITGWPDKDQMIEAHRAARVVVDFWPHLPVREEPVLPQLRKALWFLARILPDRRQVADTLGELRRATIGVPADDPAAGELAAQIARANAKHQAMDAEVRERVEHLTELAAQCQRFHDEQRAVLRARQVSRQADAVLGVVGTSNAGVATITGQQPAGDTRSYQRQLAAIQDAYYTLGQDVGSDS